MRGDEFSKMLSKYKCDHHKTNLIAGDFEKIEVYDVIFQTPEFNDD